jgi:hypothetical protein
VNLTRLFLVFCLLIGCAAQRYSASSRSQIIDMKDELAMAQKKLLQQRAYVESLEEKIAKNEIALIQKEISQIQMHETAKKMLSPEEWLAFFYQQRETLNHIIKSCPACRSEAQEVLDQILTLITQLSDQAIE